MGAVDEGKLRAVVINGFGDVRPLASGDWMVQDRDYRERWCRYTPEMIRNGYEIMGDEE